jgi:coiled-coil domain-containing protein 55
MKLSISAKGLNSKPTSLAKQPASKSKPSLFSRQAEDDDNEPSASTSKKPGNRPPTTLNTVSRLQKQKQKEAEEIDATVFQYDEVYDNMKEAQKNVKKEKEREKAAEERQVRSF